MTRESYIKVFSFLEKNRLVRPLLILEKCATVTVFILYPALLLIMAATKNEGLIKSALIPLIGFILVSVIRQIVNRQRPYKKLNYTPLVNKKHDGHSFPSRHTFSAFIIAVTLIPLFPIISLLFILCGIIIALSRVLLGVHYPSDVIFGAVFGILFGASAFII